MPGGGPLIGQLFLPQLAMTTSPAAAAGSDRE
jgi:hypothetical protein